MANTVLQIARNAAAVIGIDDFNSLIGNNQPGPQAMRVLLNRAGIAMTRMRNSWGASWTVLTTAWEFETVPGQREYAFPDDFEALIDDTLWDRDSYHEGRGTLSPQEWQVLRSGLVQTVALAPYYRIRQSTSRRARALFLEPVPSERSSLVLEYTSRNWLVGSNGSFKRNITSDTDEPLLDDELVEQSLLWRFRQSRGLSFAPELAEYEMEVKRRFAEDAGARSISVGQSAGRRWPNVPETGFGGVVVAG